MKATGIVRRIDDLGRIVIPKEIRRTLRFREGEPLEIYTDNTGEIILKKYSPIADLTEYAQCIAGAVSSTTNALCYVTDRDYVIGTSNGVKKEALSKPISKNIDKLMNMKQSFTASSELDRIAISSELENEMFMCDVAVPIIFEGDCLGSILINSDKSEMTISHLKVIGQVNASILSTLMSN